MIITRLQGGLGNQLFQYALGRALAVKNGTSLKLDLSDFHKETKNTKRTYRLDRFQIVADIAADKETARFKKYQYIPGYRHLLHNLLFSNRNIYIQEDNVSFDPKKLLLKPPLYLDGWWQTEHYFIDIAPFIRKEIELISPFDKRYSACAEEIDATPASVSLHVRRGDYITNSEANRSHGVCTPDYYARAFTHFASFAKTVKIFIFSDDIDWVVKNITIPFPFACVSSSPEKDDECQELMLMKRCKYHIIANSSFSWWGAWLSNSPEKIVIAPKKWVTKTSWNTPDRIPSSWITLT